MKWEKIGDFSVDSGTFLICDPCNIDDDDLRSQIGYERGQMYEENKENVSVQFPTQRTGLAVIGKTKIGDGFFEVYQKVNCKGQKEIKITFK